MYKKIVFIILIIAIGLNIYLIYQSMTQKSDITIEQKIIADPKNATYQIEGENFTLANGISLNQIPNSASKIVTQYFGNEVRADLNNDGINDVTFLLTQNSGGSGTFYYVVVLLSQGNNFIGTSAILLGDRIAPQTTEFQNGEIIVNYADRNPKEAMTVSPSVGVSRYFKISDNKLIEIPK